MTIDFVRGGEHDLGETRPTYFMTEKEREEKMDALKRYEQTRREHLGGAINLIFGLSTAAAGFCLSRITDKDSHFTRPGSYLFVIATIVFIITVGICIASTWTRLRDFRLTARKLRSELRGADTAELNQLGKLTDCLGKWTWWLFYSQLISFFLGVIILAIALSLLYYNQVFPALPSPDKSEPNAVGAVSSAVAGHVASRCFVGWTTERL